MRLLFFPRVKNITDTLANTCMVCPATCRVPTGKTPVEPVIVSGHHGPELEE